MNEKEFWDISYRENAPILLGVLRRYVTNTGIAQDLLHEVFITAINKYDSYKGNGNFEGWLYRIAVNTALMYLRNERNKQIPSEVLLTIADDNDQTDNQGNDARTTIEEADFSGEELLSAIDRLPEHHRVVFNMYVMDDFSHKQIAMELNISPGTSKSHLARARKKIQQFLYDDALNKKNIKDRRRASMLLLFPANTHFIDRLFRAKVSDFMLPPATGTGFLETALGQNAASATSTVSQATVSAVYTTGQAVSTTTFWGSKLSYIAICCGTVDITIPVCWLSMSENSPLQQERHPFSSEEIIKYSPESGISDTYTYYLFDNQNFVILDSTVIISDNKATSSAFSEQYQHENIAAEEQFKTKQESGSKSESALETEKISINQSNTLSNLQDQNLTGISTAEQVVVKKQIIQRQTVVVHDTIIIQE